MHALNHAFAKIPIGRHTLYACVAASLVLVLLSVFLRFFSRTIIPFEILCLGILGFIALDVLYGMIKIIPIRDKRTGETERYAVGMYFSLETNLEGILSRCNAPTGTWLYMPATHRFDLRARESVKRGIHTLQFATAFGLTYPVLGGLFFQSSIFVQALLIPVFFILRAGFEYGADALTSDMFGSDGMPVINLAGVLMHEICLSVMITSIKHPLVFASLILSDVLENSFCLYSLWRNSRRTSNSVSPTTNDEIDDEDEYETPHMMTNISFVKRPTNINALVTSKSNVSEKGTALFIAATLLQRESVETLVPVQAAAILSVLYVVDLKSNSMVSSWSEQDWIQSVVYIFVDLAVQILVFAGTVFTLRHIYPEFDVARILRGLLRTHWVEMAMLSFSLWTLNMLFQSTYAGMDMTMKFQWLYCIDDSAENSTWLGGFSWDCANNS